MNPADLASDPLSIAGTGGIDERRYWHSGIHAWCGPVLSLDRRTREPDLYWGSRRISDTDGTNQGRYRAGRAECDGADPGPVSTGPVVKRW